MSTNHTTNTTNTTTISSYTGNQTVQSNATASSNITSSTGPKGLAPPCTSAYYLNKTSNSCFACHKSCATCTGPTKGECSTCQARMFYVPGTKSGNICVGNCESVGLYYDSTNNICVGCHPACETCYGLDNNNCYECSDGFVQVSANTCDTECTPQNSYIFNDTCKTCNTFCKSCFGPSITECTECYAPYSIDSANFECVFNETLAQIVDSKYTPPMSFWAKMIIFFAILGSIFGGYLFYKIGYRIWISYQSKKDRSYNVFDKAELNPQEKKNMNLWGFDIPLNLSHQVKQEKKTTGHDHEIILSFTQENEINLVKSIIQIPPVAQFRYFEVEVLENKGDAAIYVGIIEEKDPFIQVPLKIDDLQGQQTVYIDGGEGYYIYNQQGRKIHKGLVMSEFGDCVGICMHYQDANSVAGELADIELINNPKKKKDQLTQQYVRDLNLSDQLRVLVFKDGICVCSPDQMDKDKMKIQMDGRYFVFIGSNGPCQVSFNIGGKIFRAHHEEVNKGLITSDSNRDLKNRNKKLKKAVKTNISKQLTQQP